MNHAEIATATREQLQDHLRALNLPVSGRVDELRARLAGMLEPKIDHIVAADKMAEPTEPTAPTESTGSPPAPLPVVTCPGCRKTSLDRISSGGREQCVSTYATTTYPKFRVRYCACRHCGRRWKERHAR